MESLAAKNALVTGTSRGIGRALARALSDAGARVLCHARTLADATEVAVDLLRVHTVAGSRLAVNAAVVEAGWRADPGTMNLGSAGLSIDGAAPLVAICGYGLTGVGVGEIPWASVAPARVTFRLPPLRVMKSLLTAQDGRLKYSRTSVSLPRTRGV